MKINPKIEEILEEFYINKNEGVPYLLSLFFGYKSCSFSDSLKIQINTTNIISSDKGILIWNVPLFEELLENTPSVWDWIETEYLELFKPYTKTLFKRETVARMKKMFQQNPDIRKEEVIGATELMIENTQYKRQPHYFIEKGTGTNKTRDILAWIDRYREENGNINRDSSRVLL